MHTEPHSRVDVVDAEALERVLVLPDDGVVGVVVHHAEGLAVVLLGAPLVRHDGLARRGLVVRDSL